MIFRHLTGVELTALQLSHPVLDQFIKVRRGVGREMSELFRLTTGVTPADRRDWRTTGTPGSPAG